ncbi:MAG TPA: hypothetical protein ENN19_17465 [Chloroflexi bacterium]|nr:hypothetical protein [Chloroflexota bacterium]
MRRRVQRAAGGEIRRSVTPSAVNTTIPVLWSRRIKALAINGEKSRGIPTLALIVMPVSGPLSATTKTKRLIADRVNTTKSYLLNNLG